SNGDYMHGSICQRGQSGWLKSKQPRADPGIRDHSVPMPTLISRSLGSRPSRGGPLPQEASTAWRTCGRPSNLDCASTYHPPLDEKVLALLTATSEDKGGSHPSKDKREGFHPRDQPMRRSLLQVLLLTVALAALAEGAAPPPKPLTREQKALL